MNNEEVPPVRFVGRTYSRRQKATDDGSSVPVKAAVSLSKWGKANYVPYRDNPEPVSNDIRKTKMEIGGEDPFRFDSEDKSKSPVKRLQGDRTTTLPASRLVTSGKAGQEIKDGAGKTEASIRTYSRTAAKKDDLDDDDDQFVKVGETFVNKEGDCVFLSQKPEKTDDEEDDIFPAEFKRDPLKTYGGEVVTPVDQPDSPPLKKGRYVKKGGQRGRKPLTVSDPGLIEQYKRNYAEQQQKGKRDTDVGGLNNTMVVSKQELANEDQGTTVVVVCKPKAQLEKGDVQAKYFTRTPRKQGLTVLETGASGPESSSQESPNASKNGKSESSTSSPVSQGKTKLQKSMGSGGGNETFSTPSPVSGSATRRLTRGRLSNADWSSAGSATSDTTTQSDNSGGRGGKRYRIFKTRAQNDDKKSDDASGADDSTPKTDASGKEEDESPIPSSHQTVTSTEEDLDPVDDNGKANTDQVNRDQSENPVLETENSDASPQVENDVAMEDNPNSLEMAIDQATSNQALMTCVKNLATRLKGNEKGNESDSTEQDNVSECSEILLSQESPANSQSTEEKEDIAPRRFFKSKKSLSNSSDLKRKMFGTSPQKSPAKATYNARSWQFENDDGDKEEDRQKIKTHDNGKDDMVLVKDSSKAPRLSREVHWPERTYDEAYTSLRVNKKHKELYTVVHNVKQTHEVQELGETQDFMDDVDYLLDSLRSTNSTSIRCLSCLKLAGKCIMPAFRMHIRAHGTVSKIFSLLHDACRDSSLALSTSAIMFMLSRDRLNMDLDAESLELMLRLNELDSVEKERVSDSSSKELEKTRERVKELLAQLQLETHAREIDLDFVSTGNLAMESLLSLTSRRAGEWFKEELRSVGGLDHIIDSVVSTSSQLSDDMETKIQSALPNLRKLERCFRVLENVSFMNTDNQVHLVNYKNAALLVSCGRTLRLCQKCMTSYKILESVEDNKAVKDLPGFTILTSMMGILKVLLNITHDQRASSYNKSDERTLIETALQCLINTQWCIPPDQRFDLAVLSLGLLINMIEGNKENSRSLMEIQMEVKDPESSKSHWTSAVKAIVNLFCQREEAARAMEENTEGSSNDTPTPSESPNKSGEWKETEVGIQWITDNLKKAKEEQEKQEKEAADSGSSEQKEDADTTEGNQSILEDDEETFTKALHKAGKHMENSIVASYAGLLLGRTIIHSKDYISTVKELIPNGDFKPMIKILKKFLNFMSLTTAFGSTDVNGITKVIEMLESA